MSSNRTERVISLPNVARLAQLPYLACYNVANRGLFGRVIRFDGRIYVRHSVLDATALFGIGPASAELLASFHRYGIRLIQAEQEADAARRSGLDSSIPAANAEWLRSARAGVLGQLQADRAEAEAARDRGTVAVLSLILAMLPTATYSPADGGGWNATFMIPGAIDIALPPEDAPDPGAPSPNT